MADPVTPQDWDNDKKMNQILKKYNIFSSIAEYDESPTRSPPDMQKYKSDHRSTRIEIPFPIIEEGISSPLDHSIQPLSSDKGDDSMLN